MAPEVLACPFKTRPDENKGNRNLYYELSVDTWAVGVLAYEVGGTLMPLVPMSRCIAHSGSVMCQACVDAQKKPRMSGT